MSTDHTPHDACLPFELFQLIWEQLSNDGSDGRKCLSNCSLVCREWRTPTQRALFSSTRIELAPDDCIRTHELLLSSPHIQIMIVDLGIVFHPDESTESIKALSDILSLLPSVITLEMQVGDSGPAGKLLFWSLNPNRKGSPIIDGLLSLVSRPSFTNFILLKPFTMVYKDNWAFQRFLGHAKSLKSLHLVAGAIINGPRWQRLAVPPNPPVETITLEKLVLLSHSLTDDFDGQIDGTEWARFLYPIDFSSLKELWIDNGQPSFHDLLGRVPTLEKLTVTSGFGQ